MPRIMIKGGVLEEHRGKHHVVSSPPFPPLEKFNVLDCSSMYLCCSERWGKGSD